jgi:rod shape-determining protein MreD
VKLEETDPSIYFWSALSLVLALMLQILPLSVAMAHWRPQFVFLVAIYWLFRVPSFHGIAFAWMCGLMLDLVMGELIGRHAMSFALCAYLLRLLQQRFQYMTIFHQLFLVFPLVLLHQLLVHSTTLMLRPTWQGELVVAPAVSSLLIWPLLAWVLAKFGTSEAYEDEEISSS